MFKAKQFALFLLVFAAPLGDFLGFYLDGRGVIPEGTGFLIGAASMLLLPFLVSGVIVFFCAKSLTGRILGFAGTLVVQFTFVFALVPPGAQSEMIGIGHRLRSTFKANEIEACAQLLLRKNQVEALATNTTPKHPIPPFTSETRYIADSELPPNLQGKFKNVGIDSSQKNLRVLFEILPHVGILYGKNYSSQAFFHYQFGTNVYAYRYERL